MEKNKHILIKEYQMKIICDLHNEIELNEYRKQAGVWALYAKKNNLWECVQVAKTDNIASEIRIDIERIKNEVEEKPVKKTYYNQFGERCSNIINTLQDRIGYIMKSKQNMKTLFLFI